MDFCQTPIFLSYTPARARNVNMPRRLWGSLSACSFVAALRLVGLGFEGFGYLRFWVWGSGLGCLVHWSLKRD